LRLQPARSEQSAPGQAKTIIKFIWGTTDSNWLSEKDNQWFKWSWPEAPNGRRDR